MPPTTQDAVDRPLILSNTPYTRQNNFHSKIQPLHTKQSKRTCLDRESILGRVQVKHSTEQARILFGQHERPMRVARVPVRVCRHNPSFDDLLVVELPVHDHVASLQILIGQFQRLGSEKADLLGLGRFRKYFK